MGEAPFVVLEVRLPRRVYEALLRASEAHGVTVEDIVARGILKALEELGVKV